MKFLLFFHLAYTISSALYGFVGMTEMESNNMHGGMDFYERIRFAAPLLLAWLAWFVIVLSAIGGSFIDDNEVPTTVMLTTLYKRNEQDLNPLVNKCLRRRRRSSFVLQY